MRPIPRSRQGSDASLAALRGGPGRSPAPGRLPPASAGRPRAAGKPLKVKGFSVPGLTPSAPPTDQVKGCSRAPSPGESLCRRKIARDGALIERSGMYSRHVGPSCCRRIVGGICCAQPGNELERSCRCRCKTREVGRSGGMASVRSKGNGRSRQARWQAARVAEGRCAQCGARRRHYPRLCDPCAMAVRRRNRERAGNSPWRPGGPGRPPIIADPRRRSRSSGARSRG